MSNAGPLGAGEYNNLLQTGDPVIILSSFFNGQYGRINTNLNALKGYCSINPTNVDFKDFSVFVPKVQVHPIEFFWYEIEKVSEEEYLAFEVVHA